MDPEHQATLDDDVAFPTSVISDSSDYVLSINPSETERLRMQHDVVKDAMGGRLVLAPIDLTMPGLRILDSATADGFWLEDLRLDHSLGDRSPPCALIGTDIVPSFFPKPEERPQGVEFRVQSITSPWPETDKNSFDLVHQRLGLFGTGENLSKAVTGLVGLVKPGGWIQIVDADLSGPEADSDSPMAPAVRLIKMLLGKSLDDSDAYGANLKNLLEGEGLVAVEERVLGVRFGALNTNHTLAQKSTESFVHATEGMVAAAKNIPGWPSHSLDDIIPTMKKGLDETGGTFRYWVVWGQKPIKL